MEQFTIYCTAEQTKKALKLGAPIEVKTIEDAPKEWYGKSCFTEMGTCALFPSAEQMIGWLEKELRTQISITFDKYRQWLFNIGYGNNLFYASRKEATLTAIDAALDYLDKGTNNE